MDITEILKKVPDYSSFKTVDQLKQSSAQLCTEYPDIVEKKFIGKSKNGEEIEVLKIGEGTRNVLLFACPHPNEPIGSMMLDYLAKKLCVDDDLREEMNLTWYIIKCIDPDGTRLNEGWFKGPFTIENYARNFYRPASFEQVEWTFPIEYKTMNFNAPIPETEALMNIIRKIKPDFMYSLHNSGFGGVYYYISEPRQELFEPFIQLAVNRKLPISLGEPEMPYAVEYSDAIFQLTSIRDAYDYLEENTSKDPATIISGGTSSFDYLRNYNKGAFSMVCEMPYFYDSRIEDTGPGSISRKKAILESADISEKAFDFLREKLKNNRDLLTHQSSFKTAVSEFVRTAPENIKAQRNWAKENKEMDKIATVAQVFDNLVITRFYILLMIGMTIRLFSYEINQGEQREKSKIKRLEQEKRYLEEFFNNWLQQLEAELNYDVIPIKKLVEVQLGSALYVLSSL